MCLILMALETHPQYPLIIAANRDEFYRRPTKPAHFWEEDPSLLAGRDLQAGGTWLGLTRSGRFAAVTNYRDPRHMHARSLSRGRLTADFLLSGDPTKEYIESISNIGHRYNGFNLLLSQDLRCVQHYSNITANTTVLSPGIHGLSNHLLDTPWPKVENGRHALGNVLAQGDPDVEAIFNILSDTTPAEDTSLPDTGVGVQLERQLSPICIRMEGYGTRCSTLILVDQQQIVHFEERTLSEQNEVDMVRKYSFQIDA